MSNTSNTPKIRLTVDLPRSSVQELTRIASRQGITMTEALRRSIGTEYFIKQEIKKGAHLLLLSSRQEMSEIIFY